MKSDNSLLLYPPIKLIPSKFLAFPWLLYIHASKYVNKNFQNNDLKKTAA